MTLQRLLLGATAALALAFPMAASAAGTESTTVHVGTYASPTNPAYFFITSGTPYSSSITANFGNTITGASTAFDDFFQFTIPQNGVGSGSLSTSFSAASNQLSIMSVIIDGTSYTAAQAAAGIGGIPISDDALNTIEVKGTTGPSTQAATYTGTATFAAVSAAPEPASWLLMVGGIGCIGMFMRRRTTALNLA